LPIKKTVSMSQEERKTVQLLSEKCGSTLEEDIFLYVHNQGMSLDSSLDVTLTVTSGVAYDVGINPETHRDENHQVIAQTVQFDDQLITEIFSQPRAKNLTIYHCHPRGMPAPSYIDMESMMLYTATYYQYHDDGTLRFRVFSGEKPTIVEFGLHPTIAGFIRKKMKQLPITKRYEDNSPGRLERQYDLMQIDAVEKFLLDVGKEYSLVSNNYFDDFYAMKDVTNTAVLRHKFINNLFTKTNSTRLFWLFVVEPEYEK